MEYPTRLPFNVPSRQIFLAISVNRINPMDGAFPTRGDKHHPTQSLKIIRGAAISGGLRLERVGREGGEGRKGRVGVKAVGEVGW